MNETTIQIIFQVGALGAAVAYLRARVEAVVSRIDRVEERLNGSLKVAERVARLEGREKVMLSLVSRRIKECEAGSCPGAVPEEDTEEQ